MKPVVVRTDLCVYVMFRETGEPFYVGKGRYDRPKDHIREAKIGSPHNKHKQNIIKKLLREFGEVPVVIIRDELTNDQACEIEVALIAAIGRADLGKGPLVNLTDRGEGTTGYKFTEVEKAKISCSNKAFLG